jgi:hypothetical protein
MLTPKTFIFAGSYKTSKILEKKNLNLNNNGVRSQLAYPENAIFLSISDFLGSHIVQSKEHTEKRK